MASVYRDKSEKKQNYDEQIMSAEDYAALQGYQDDWHNATDDAGRQQAHQNAESLRERYGYSMGADGNSFSLLNPQTGVSQNTQTQQMIAQNHNPLGQSDFYNQWTELLNQYANREDFSYDLGSDALYQQYADQYTRLGQQAMEDTMGQAAGLTGGYGSSYSQNVGQQAYQGYLDQLNDMVPELYNQAYNRYNQEGQELLNAAQMAGQGYQMEAQDYWNNMNYWQQQAANEQNQYWNQQNYDFNQQQYADSQQQQAYENMVTAISNTGYVPTADELADAGMTQSEANYWAQYFQYNRMKAAGSGSSGSSGGRSGGSGRSSGSSGSGSGSSSTNRVWEAAAAMASQHGTGSSAPWLDSGWLDSTLYQQGYSAAEIAQIKAYLHDNHGWRYMYEGR